MTYEIVVPIKLDVILEYESSQELVPGQIVKVDVRGKKYLGFVKRKIQATKGIELKQIEQVLEIKLGKELVDFISWVAEYYGYSWNEVYQNVFVPDVGSRVKNTEYNLEKAKNLPQLTLLQGKFAEFANATNKPIVLHGVPGSGKTRAYFEVLKDCFANGKSVLVLVPEIVLTPHIKKEIEGMLGVEVFLFHSNLSKGQRIKTWHALADAKGSIVVLGTRSALWLPIKDLGLIIIDEEHDPSYKQEEKVKYNARDMAVVRAYISKAKIILVSATPSLETYYNTKTGKYSYFFLPEPIHKQDTKISIFELGKSFGGNLISEDLAREIETDTSKVKLLFLNRKGFASVVKCECGNVLRCPNCEIPLTYYSGKKELTCHYCSYEEPFAEVCPICGGKRFFSFNYGLEKLQAELKQILGDVSSIKVDRSVVTSHKRVKSIFEDIYAGKYQVVVGTQMICKGHDFPNVGLVVIVLADMILDFPDFRAVERTGQLLFQTIGRSGRRGEQSKVCIQTFDKSHYIYDYLKELDWTNLCEKELVYREKYLYPPFYKLLKLNFISKEDAVARSMAEDFVNSISNNKELIPLGPVLAPLGRLRRQYNYQILIKSQKLAPLKEIIKKTKMISNRSVNVLHDLDPLNMLF